MSLYNNVNAMRPVIGHCHLVEYRYMDEVTGNFVFFVLLNMARGFENVCEIISDKTSESLQKSLAGAIYKEEQGRNGNKKSS